MRFEYAKLLWLLLIVLPGLIAFFWWAAREKRRLLDRFVNPRLLGQLLSGISLRLQKAHAALLIAAAAFIVVALARPQWGFDFEEVKQRGLDIIVAIDTSRSMLADDVAPNRLARAKLAALDLRKLAKADRMGLIAFAGSAFLQCPLSSDEEVFRQSINELNVNIIPQGGTALAEAIDCARTAFKDKGDNHKVLVMFTDGEDHDGNAVPSAKAAGKDGLHIFTVGVGTPNGENLRITDARGRSEYITDSDGQKVTSRLNDQLLKEIAEASAGPGFYSLLGGARTMEILYERGLAPLPKGELGSRQIKRYHERFQWFLFFAIIALVAEIFVPERKKSARSTAASATPELARAAMFLLFLACSGTLGAASASKAQKEYGTGKYERALHQYQDLLQKEPDEPRLNFNAGDAAFQAGFYDRALKHFNSSLATEDLQLQERSFYNIGNSQYRLGEEETDPSKKQGSWEQAITSYDSALKLDPNDGDAKYNRELVKKKLEELKQQQQKQKQDNQKQDKSDDMKDQQQDQQKQENQDQKDQSKSEQQKNEEKQQQQQKQQEQQQQKPEDQQQQQAQKPDDKQEKKDASQQQVQPKPGDEDKGESEEPQEPGKPMKKIQMTPQQAIRLLESLKNDERSLVFLPPLKTNRNERAIKNW